MGPPTTTPTTTPPPTPPAPPPGPRIDAPRVYIAEPENDSTNTTSTLVVKGTWTDGPLTSPTVQVKLEWVASSGPLPAPRYSALVSTPQGSFSVKLVDVPKGKILVTAFLYSDFHPPASYGPVNIEQA